MAHGSCELLWLKLQLHKLGFKKSGPMILHCDSISTLHIANNAVYHKYIKQIEVDCQFTREDYTKLKIQLEYASMKDQIAEFLTNAMIKKQLYDVLSKLDIVNIHLPA
eukprot:TRINITY_DN11664_c0_g2_i3.p1 TRINITY_DN11664_c0_g2~~TRINITY_DN11664_c0_g2_i3.p1  ORF type:complete len:108 (+),score=12.01 TRINITY_DN11664_c0_g2_i3:1376-1699(+)